MKGTSRILTLSTESCRLMRGAEKTDFEYILESQAEHQMFLLSDQGYAGSYRYRFVRSELRPPQQCAGKLKVVPRSLNLRPFRMMIQTFLMCKRRNNQWQVYTIHW